MHEPIPKVGEWLRRVLTGYYQYTRSAGQLGQPETLPGTEGGPGDSIV